MTTKESWSSNAAEPAPSEAVVAALANYPEAARTRLCELRRLIFDTARDTTEAGALEETLKWGEPAYLTRVSGSGTTIRIGWHAKRPDHYALYFNCRTNLVESFRGVFGDTLQFEGNRAVLFPVNDPLPKQAAALCIRAALTYHRRKRALQT